MIALLAIKTTQNHLQNQTIILKIRLFYKTTTPVFSKLKFVNHQHKTSYFAPNFNFPQIYQRLFVAVLKQCLFTFVNYYCELHFCV
ncbi:hypothetical protein A0256_11055 [Mucilaginibacter sp. PAMC 26640]|nr:hypothetical protein A0256_11055 [Mucilaginibacter sp. PAMC 26640]